MSRRLISQIGLLVAVFFLSVAVQGYASFREPNTTPPNANVNAPLNTGSSAQTKSGNLTVKNLITGTGGFNFGTVWTGGVITSGNIWASGNIIASNDVWIGKIGKWASQLGGSSSFTCRGTCGSWGGTSSAWTACTAGNGNYPHCGSICTPRGWSRPLAPCGGYY